MKKKLVIEIVEEKTEKLRSECRDADSDDYLKILRDRIVARLQENK
jgi:hypothetical protein